MLTIDSSQGPRSDRGMGTSFADTVRKERARRRWSQAKLAEEAKVAPASIYRLEKGEAPDDGHVAEAVRAALGLSGGQFLSAPPLKTAETGATLPSTMGQMIGRLQLPAGVEDYYQTMLEIALEQQDPAEVFRELAKARAEAPAEAGAGWWVRKYLAAKGRSGAP